MTRRRRRVTESIIAYQLTVPRRLALALALSALCHVGLLALTWRGAPQGAAGVGGAEQRFSVAIVGRPGAGQSSVAPARVAGPAGVDAQAVVPEPPPPAEAPAAASVEVRSQESAAAPRRTVTAPVVPVRPEREAVAHGDAAAARAPSAGLRGVHDGGVVDSPSDAGAGGGGGGPSPGQRLASTGSGAAAAIVTGADLRPWCRTCPVPVYPARARRRGWQGTVEVDLDLNGDGSVGGARVTRSSGFPALDEAAIAVARRSSFRISEQGGALRGKLRYQFRLEHSL